MQWPKFFPAISRLLLNRSPTIGSFYCNYFQIKGVCSKSYAKIEQSFDALFDAWRNKRNYDGLLLKSKYHGFVWNQRYFWEYASSSNVTFKKNLSHRFTFHLKCHMVLLSLLVKYSMFLYRNCQKFSKRRLKLDILVKNTKKEIFFSIRKINLLPYLLVFFTLLLSICCPIYLIIISYEQRHAALQNSLSM